MTHQDHSDKPAIGSDPPEKWFSFLGLVIVRRTDLLAAVAFTLSISTISYQAWQFLRGANPAIFPPDTLYVYFDRYANGIIATRLAGQISFTNKGDTGHNAIIRDVSATITLGPRTINENWLSFAAVTRRDTALSLDIKETAHPVVVNGGSASSYMITFSPRAKDCPVVDRAPSCNQAAEFVSDTEFLTLLSQEKKATVTFVAQVFDSKQSLKTLCTISITDDMFRTMAKNDWYATRCVPTVDAD